MSERTKLLTCLSPDLYWVARTWGWSQPHLELCEGCTETGSFSELRSLWIWAKTGAYHSQFLFLSSIDQCLLKEEEGEGEVAQSCPTLWDPLDCSLPGSPSMGFSRQEYWSGLPFPSPGDLPDPGIKPGSPALEADALTTEPQGNPF